MHFCVIIKKLYLCISNARKLFTKNDKENSTEKRPKSSFPSPFSLLAQAQPTPSPSLSAGPSCGPAGLARTALLAAKPRRTAAPSAYRPSPPVTLTRRPCPDAVVPTPINPGGPAQRLRPRVKQAGSARGQSGPSWAACVFEPNKPIFSISKSSKHTLDPLKPHILSNLTWIWIIPFPKFF